MQDDNVKKLWRENRPDEQVVPHHYHDYQVKTGTETLNCEESQGGSLNISLRGTFGGWLLKVIIIIIIVLDISLEWSFWKTEMLVQIITDFVFISSTNKRRSRLHPTRRPCLLPGEQLNDEGHKPEHDGGEGVDEGQRGSHQKRVAPLPDVAHWKVDGGQVVGIALGNDYEERMRQFVKWH